MIWVRFVCCGQSWYTFAALWSAAWRCWLNIWAVIRGAAVIEPLEVARIQDVLVPEYVYED
jgi:hypothetical protein